MYNSLVVYLKENNIKLEKHMFRAVLKSLNGKNNGHSARSANSWAWTTELIERYSTSTDEEVKKVKKELANYSNKVFKFHEENNKE